MPDVVKIEAVSGAEGAASGIAVITLNRSDKLNAIDGALMDGVDAALTELESGAYRVAILTGAGRGFCAGADLSATGQGWTTQAKTQLKTSYDAQVRLAAYGVWQTKTGLNTALDAPSLRHAKEIENRTQVLSTFTGNAAEAAIAHREKRAPVWNEL